MKIKQLVAILIVLVLVVVVIMTAGKHSTSTPATTNSSGEGNIAGTMPVGTRHICYVWNTEAGDHAALDMMIAEDSSVTGSFDWVPAQKDSKRGSFEGVIGPLDQNTMARTATLWWHTNAEGMSATEQLYVQMGDGSAAAGFGEMKDRGDGTYVYANPSAISYVPTLSQTSCSDEAL